MPYFSEEGWNYLVISLFTSLAGVLAFYFWRKHRDPYEIEACRFPDCVRCRRYAVVNQTALRKLPWVTKKQNNLERVVQGVRGGRRQQRRDSTMAPVRGQYPTVLLIPGLTSQPILTQLHWKNCQYLETNAQKILDEYNQAWKSATWMENTTDASAPWNVLHIMNQGRWKEETIKQFPVTTQLVKHLSLLEGCVFGNVLFSHVQTGSHIRPHCGPTNVRHRLHLPLRATSTPILRVREKQLHWKTFEALAFDDSLRHSVEYPGRNEKEERVVLIVDLWHPDLTPIEREAIRDLYPA